MKGYMSLTEAAELMGMSRQRVHALVKNGKLPAERIGRQWVVRERDVLARMEAPRDVGGRPRKDAK